MKYQQSQTVICIREPQYKEAFFTKGKEYKVNRAWKSINRDNSHTGYMAVINDKGLEMIFKGKKRNKFFKIKKESTDEKD